MELQHKRSAIEAGTGRDKLNSSKSRPSTELEGTSFEEIQFVENIDKAKYTCPYCQKILRPRVKQTPCGHRLCGVCVEQMFEHEEHVTCPANEEDCEVNITKNQVSLIFADYSKMLMFETLQT